MITARRPTRRATLPRPPAPEPARKHAVDWEDPGARSLRWQPTKCGAAVGIEDIADCFEHITCEECRKLLTED